MALGARQSFGRYVAIESPLHALDSFVKIVVFLLVLVSIFVASTWIGLACVAGYVFVLCRASRTGLSFYLGSLKYFAWMFALSFAINVAFPREGRAFAFSVGAVNAAGFFSVRLALMIVAATVFTMVTCPSEIGDGLLALTRAKGRAGRRAVEFASLLSISLRFVPVMFEEAERIKAARILRGERIRGFAGRVRLVVGIIVPLMESSLRRATNLGFALEARCYGYRTPASPRLRLARHEFAFGASAIVLLLLLMWLR